MNPTPVSWLLLCVLALCIGSFLNVVIYRLPLMLLNPQAGLSLWQPRSHCPCCKRPVRPADAVPLLSWLLLRGRCRCCHQPVSWRYPAVEAASAAITLLLAAWLPWNAALLAALLLSGFLLTLTLIDLRCQLLPDALTLPLLWLGLLLHSCQLLPFGHPSEAILGAAGGYLLFRLLACAWSLFRHREALGGGDAKLVAALGGWLGWQALPLLLLIASGVGLLAALLARLCWDRPLHLPLPFGPCLALAGEALLLGMLT
ncbi:prepilin peptidase [Candidatus Pantoea alvi]|uniref:prepilin peptidase n=1 Tax=Enterobacter agglomerans TaxID=549 RepID=UPI000CDDE976|nr:A24 family peptidase [Pantoea agglomerans]POW59298.1 prepilin peptidase [Pantoea alvi]UBN55197.1 prepilin peptidase [Pantoea agglomerans]